MLMHRQTPLAFGVLASCAVIASGSILLREQILSFSSWPEASRGGDAPEIAIPNVRPLAPHAAGTARPGEATPRVVTDAARAGLLGLGVGGGTFTLASSRPVVAGGGAGGGASGAPGGPQLTTLGRTGSGHPGTGPAGGAPLSAYGPGILTRRRRPVAGEAGSAGSGSSPSRRAPSRWRRRPRSVSLRRRRPMLPLRLTSRRWSPRPITRRRRKTRSARRYSWNRPGAAGGPGARA